MAGEANEGQSVDTPAPGRGASRLGSQRVAGKHYRLIAVHSRRRPATYAHCLFVWGCVIASSPPRVPEQRNPWPLALAPWSGPRPHQVGLTHPPDGTAEKARTKTNVDKRRKVWVSSGACQSVCVKALGKSRWFLLLLLLFFSSSSSSSSSSSFFSSSFHGVLHPQKLYGLLGTGKGRME